MDRIREVGFAAARRAGAIQLERLGKINNIDYKSAFNLVTDVDKESEAAIIGIIKHEFPDHQILAEETGAHRSASAARWIIDPLDGTTNYAHGYPFFCVSIGFEEAGEMKFGVVFNAVSNEMFWAERGQGAKLNDKAIHVSANKTLATSLLVTGFPADTQTAKISNMTEFARLTDSSHGVRRDGSAALDLSFVACGRLDAFWELKLAPWDLAAGTLIVREAGGKVTNLTGGPFDINTGHVLADNGLIHDELIKVLAFTDGLGMHDNVGTETDVARK
jgi:myo-inositol-1(or 4)-monophosphatase